MSEYVALIDTYEYAINNFHKRTDVEKIILSRVIADLEFINIMIAEQGKLIFESFVNEVADKINKHDIPVNLLSFSAMVYEGGKAGFNVSRLIKSINTNSEWIIEETNKNILINTQQ